MKLTKTKRDIAVAVAHKHDVEIPVAQMYLESFLDEIKRALINGHEVSMREFAHFRQVRRKAKVAQDIPRGTPINLPAKTVVKIKVSPILQKEVDNKNNK